MNLQVEISRRIARYEPKGELEHTARLFMAMGRIHHRTTLEHMQRVALMAEASTKDLHRDAKAAFFAGLLHDVGKLVMDPRLFDGHEITEEEYGRIKTHALTSFKLLKPFHVFLALCAGLHHALYEKGYGLETKDFPTSWRPSTIKKVLETSILVSICDFIDAHEHRHNKIKDGSNAESTDLREMLYRKYPDDHRVVDVALKHII